MSLPFPVVPMPADYPGKHIWFTLCFVDEAPAWIPFGGLDVSWEVQRTIERVDGATLAISQVLLDGPIIGKVAIAGQDCWKIDTGKGSSRFVPCASLHGKEIERVASENRRRVQLSYDGEPSAFRQAVFDRALVALHGKHPLVAVLFQDGNWFDGEPLDRLEDAALVARLGKPRPDYPRG